MPLHNVIILPCTIREMLSSTGRSNMTVFNLLYVQLTTIVYEPRERVAESLFATLLLCQWGSAASQRPGRIHPCMYCLSCFLTGYV